MLIGAGCAVAADGDLGPKCKAELVRDSVFDSKQPHPGAQNPMCTLNWISPNGRIGWLSSPIGNVIGDLIDIDTRQVLPASSPIAQGLGEAKCASHAGDLVYAEPALQHGTGVLLRPDGQVVGQMRLIDRAHPQFTPNDDGLYYCVRGQTAKVTLVLLTFKPQSELRLIMPQSAGQIAVSRDLHVIATADSRREICIWRPPLKQVARKIDCSLQLVCLRLSPKGDRLVAGETKVDPSKITPRDPSQMRPQHLTRNGQLVLRGRFAPNAIAFYDTTTGQLVSEFAPEAGELLQINTDGDAALFRDGDTWVIYSLPDGKPLRHYILDKTADDELYCQDLSTVIIRDDTHEMVYRLTENLAD